jgi:hypothetical protein
MQLAATAYNQARVSDRNSRGSRLEEERREEWYWLECDAGPLGNGGAIMR